MSDKVILIGGSKNGLVTDGATGMNGINNIVLNEDLTGPEYVDRYVPTGVEDRDGNAVYAFVGRYTAEESESYWEKLDKEQVEALIEQTKAEREEEAQKAAEEAEAAAEEAKAKIEVPEPVDQTKSTTEAPAEVEPVVEAEPVVEPEPVLEQNAETGEVAPIVEATNETAEKPAE